MEKFSSKGFKRRATIKISRVFVCMCVLVCAASLGVEPVDKDVMKRPPRRPDSSMITLPLLFQIISTAVIIVLGTLYVFWKEVGVVTEYRMGGWSVWLAQKFSK